MQHGVANPHAGRLQLGASADGDGVRLRVLVEDVERLRSRDPEAAPLADGEVMVAAMAAELAAGAVDDVSLAFQEAAVAAQEVGLALAGEEAEVLALGLAGDREGVAGGDLPHLRLGQLGQREADALEDRRRQRRQHVALVLLRVRRRGEQQPLAVVDEAGIVAGDEMAGAEASRQVDHRGDPHLAVAGDAGVRRPPRRVAGDELRHDATAELLLEIEDQVRDAERMRERAGAENRLR